MGRPLVLVFNQLPASGGVRIRWPLRQPSIRCTMLVRGQQVSTRSASRAHTLPIRVDTALQLITSTLHFGCMNDIQREVHIERPGVHRNASHGLIAQIQMCSFSLRSLASNLDHPQRHS